MLSKVFLAFIIASCTGTGVNEQSDGTDYRESILITSLAPSTMHINVIPGTLEDLQNVKSVMLYFELDDALNTSLWSIDVDYNRSRLYVFDVRTAAVYAVDNFSWKYDFNITLKTGIHYGLSRSYVHISVDWISNNIYWADPLFRWIIVQSGVKADVYKILISDDLQQPYALAVDSTHNYLFWSDVGTSTKIERASLTGKGRRTIISEGLIFPTSIAVDVFSNKVVWVDVGVVGTANLDGTNQVDIHTSIGVSFYDVAVFREVVGAVDLNTGTLFVIEKTTGKKMVQFTDPYDEPFVALALYSASTQPYVEDMCSTFGCSDICINDNGGPKCMCKEGFKLNTDGFTCLEDLGYFHRAIMWSTSDRICMMDIRGLTTDEHTDSKECFVKGSNIAYFDIDMTNRNVVFSDDTYLYQISLGKDQVRETLLSASQSITGVSIDWRNGNVYWCMGSGEGKIGLLIRETLVQKTLADDLSFPHDLIVLPLNNTMFWISGIFETIQQSDLDGLNRQTIFSTNYLTGLNGLTVDVYTNSLYFIDGHNIRSCDLNGKQLYTFVPESALFLCIVIYKNYLVLTNASDIKAYQKISGQSEPIPMYTLATVDDQTITDLKILDVSLQPDQNVVTSPVTASSSVTTISTQTTTLSPAKASERSSISDSGIPVAVVAGGVTGLVAFVAIIFVVVIVIKRQCSRSSSQQDHQFPSSSQGSTGAHSLNIYVVTNDNQSTLSSVSPGDSGTERLGATLTELGADQLLTSSRTSPIRSDMVTYRNPPAVSSDVQDHSSTLRPDSAYAEIVTGQRFTFTSTSQRDAVQQPSGIVTHTNQPAFPNSSRGHGGIQRSDSAYVAVAGHESASPSRSRRQRPDSTYVAVKGHELLSLSNISHSHISRQRPDSTYVAVKGHELLSLSNVSQSHISRQRPDSTYASVVGDLNVSEL